jgi:hypothetical protein
MTGELPDFMTDANAVLNDKDHEWRYNRVPDYKKVNAAYEEGNKIIHNIGNRMVILTCQIIIEKTCNHAEGSLEWLVSNLVKVMYHHLIWFLVFLLHLIILYYRIGKKKCLINSVLIKFVLLTLPNIDSR